MKAFKTVLALACAWLIAAPAFAAPANQVPQILTPSGAYVTAPPSSLVGFDTGSGLPCIVGAVPTCQLLIAGSFSATTNPFTPTGVTTKITAGSGTSASGALSATGPNLSVYNSGANPVWLAEGIGSATAAVGTSYYIGAGQTIGIASGANTFVAVFGVGGTSDVYFTPGSGSPAGWGGGGGGGGGSLSAKANAASQTSTEAATADPLSMNLNRALRIIPTWNGVDINTAAPGGVIGVDGATIASLTNPFPIGLADSRPASSTISAVDAGTTTIAGMSSVTLVTGTPTASSFQVQAVAGMSSGTITVPTTPFVATLNVEGSGDGGVTYAPLKGTVRGSNVLANQITQATILSVDVTSLTHVRVRATSYTSGTPTVQMTFSAAPGMTKLLNGVTLVDALGAPIDFSLSQTVLQGGSWAMDAKLAPQAGLAYALTVSPSASAAATSLLGKAAPANVFSYNCNGGTAGKCILYDNSAVPGAGALTASKVMGCKSMAAGGDAGETWDYPRRGIGGVVVLFSTGADCLTYTASSTAYINVTWQ